MEMCTLDKPHGNIAGLSFSPDGRTLAGQRTDPGSIVLWQSAEGP
jgi:hypothetical protein